jgi:hypothetical protein
MLILMNHCNLNCIKDGIGCVQWVSIKQDNEMQHGGCYGLLTGIFDKRRSALRNDVP